MSVVARNRSREALHDSCWDQSIIEAPTNERYRIRRKFTANTFVVARAHTAAIQQSFSTGSFSREHKKSPPPVALHGAFPAPSDEEARREGRVIRPELAGASTRTERSLPAYPSREDFR